MGGTACCRAFELLVGSRCASIGSNDERRRRPGHFACQFPARACGPTADGHLRFAWLETVAFDDAAELIERTWLSGFNLMSASARSSDSSPTRRRRLSAPPPSRRARRSAVHSQNLELDLLVLRFRPRGEMMASAASEIRRTRIGIVGDQSLLPPEKVREIDAESELIFGLEVGLLVDGKLDAAFEPVLLVEEQRRTARSRWNRRRSGSVRTRDASPLRCARQQLRQRSAGPVSDSRCAGTAGNSRRRRCRRCCRPSGRPVFGKVLITAARPEVVRSVTHSRSPRSHEPKAPPACRHCGTLHRTVPPTKTVDSSRAPAPTALRWKRQPTILEILVGRHHRHQASAGHVDADIKRDRERRGDLQILCDAEAEHRPQHLIVVLLTASDTAHPGLIELPAALAERRRRAAENRPVSGGHRRLWGGEEDAGQEKSRVQHRGEV